MAATQTAFTLNSVTTTSLNITVTYFGDDGALGRVGTSADVYIVEFVNVTDSGNTYMLTTPTNYFTLNVQKSISLSDVLWDTAPIVSVGDSITVELINDSKQTIPRSDAMPGTVTSGGGIPCFLAHSNLFTPSGYKAAKDIKTGELLVTADGRKVPVKAYSFTVEETTKASAPFVIYKDAFRNGYPKADLYLSPEHAIMVKKDLWTMPKWLQTASPTKVKQYDIGKKVTYYHFEAPDYFKDNFVCEGTVVESFAANQLAGMKGSIWSFSVQENGYKRLTAKPPVKAILM